MDELISFALIGDFECEALVVMLQVLEEKRGEQRIRSMEFPRFNIYEFSHEDCVLNFRFDRHGPDELLDALHFPSIIKIENRSLTEMGIIFESNFLDWTFLATIIVVILFHKLNSTSNFWKLRDVKYVPLSRYIGETFRKRTPLQDLFNEVYNTFPEERFIGTFQIFRPVLMIRDPQLMKDILVKNYDHFQSRGFKVDVEREPLKNSIFFAEGFMWRHLRYKLSPTFSSGKMKRMFHLMLECANHLKTHLEKAADKDQVVDFHSTMGNFTMDVIGSCAFGININEDNEGNERYRKVAEMLRETSAWKAVRRLLILWAPKLAKLFSMTEITEDINEFFIESVKKNIEYREKNNVVRHDFIQQLIQLKNEGRVHEEEEDDDAENKIEKSELQKMDKSDYKDANGSSRTSGVIEFTYEVLAAQAYIFFVAGLETSSYTLSFVLYLLAVNPDVQERARNEVDEILQKYDGNLTYESLQDMPYLCKVLYETLRMYGPGIVIPREVTKPYTIPGTNLKLDVGQLVWIPQWCLHYDSTYFPNPLRFDPERFSEEAKASRPQYTFMPFGEGPKNCIGKMFALLQMKVVLTVLLSNYEFNVCEETNIPPIIDAKSFLTAPEGGMPLKITTRMHV